ncbi:uncharacterized protein CIMG_11033 [Coccidioides immitis RS]|uniref:Protein kinase domain-containing protein n=3 Tax=Coccidioides immitis TaxID=5501 RepID=A0A0D8JVR9_COCIM|nr:uncharacterized protein CIMG_11033 [Coccidioides immitis RS]KJF61425.1 hypothetical protein CIMG_11033 [Coccidioides immitis RS]KMP07134.1 hypothetical protein CIRG_06815 [Coccidioides immitis RMSCC 2394]KMU82055.1 hypothetical protein CISG_09282 [Coccidioides immitis RMSCC 3703]TPX19151.1 hypothetical protein DIZ76_016937 [Coccidioides immitis]
MPKHTDLPRGPEGTIYEKEKGFDDNLRIEIDPTKIKFIKELKGSEASSIFHVKYDGNPRVLKVFHNSEDAGYADDGVRDLNRARCEIRAYCSLKRSGICDQGHVPQFYGYTLSLNPAAHAPHLEAFRHEGGLLSAILIEYLPNPLLMNCVTYSKDQMAKAVDGIKQIHSALVEHNDPYPKNILIVRGNPERVMWIDFDVAITYPDSTYIGDRERG